MRRSVLCALCAAALALAQSPVDAVRIAGLPYQDWPPGDGGSATRAYLTPSALVFDRTGNLLIADTANNRIRKLAPDGTIATAFDNTPGVIALALDSHGNLYVSESRLPDPAQILRIDAAGARTFVSPLVRSQSPSGIAVDAADNLYLTDFDGETVWKRTPAGGLQRVAGNGRIGTDGEGGPALAASLLGPRRLAFDRAGNLLIADAQRVLRVNPDGTLSKLAGGGLSSLEPQGMASAPDGSIYIASGQGRIWRWDPASGPDIFAGTGEFGFSDGCAVSGGGRLARNAMLTAADVVLDAQGRLYFADGWNSRVRRIDPNGEIHTVAGSGSPPLSADSGPALGVIVRRPGALAADSLGNVYYAEPSANRVRRISASGEITTVAGAGVPPGEDPACYAASGDDLSAPGGLAATADGSLLITDTGHGRILRRAPSGAFETIAEGLEHPGSIAVRDDIWFFDSQGLHRIRPHGAVESVAAPAGVSSVAVRPGGRLVLTGNSGIWTGTPEDGFLPIQTVAEYSPVAVDTADNIVTVNSAGLRTLTSGCHASDLRGAWIAGSAGGLAAGEDGSVYAAGPDSIWRVPPQPTGPTELPSPLLSFPGVFNAASNFMATELVSSTNPFHPPTPVPANDSIAPGEILRIRGGCLGPLQPLAAMAGPLPRQLQHTRVLIGGVEAPLYRVQSAEILAQVPGSVTPGSTVTLTVENQGVRANAALKVEAAVPGVFVSNAPQAAAINEDGTPNSAANPAEQGSVLALFLTGAGLTAPLLEDGVPAPDPPPPLALGTTVAIAGLAAEVLYAGAVTGLSGVAQLNVRVPAVSGTTLPVVVGAGGISRGQYVTVAVR